MMKRFINGDSMKVLLKVKLVLMLLMTTGCDDAMYEIDETIYSYNEISDIDLLDTGSLVIEMDSDYSFGEDELFISEFINELTFKVNYDELVYDYVIRIDEGNPTFYFYISGTLENASIALYGIDEQLYRSVEDISPLLIRVYERIEAKNNYLEVFEPVTEFLGYTLYRMKNETFEDYMVSDHNRDLYIPVIDHKTKYKEVAMPNGGVVVEVVEYGYTEYMTTKLVYFNAVFYVEYDGERLTLNNPSIPKTVLEEFIREESHLFLFGIQLE